MGKTALGKGMKDLLTKNLDVGEQKAPKKDKKKAHEELDVNIGRYKAQGYDVALLRSLNKKDPEDILKGIEDYRDKVRILNSVQTILRSLEGYGYSKEIEAINERIKDPKKARELIQEVEELKYRAKTEHAIETQDKSSPGRKLAESLKEKALLLRHEAPVEGSVGPEDLDEIDIEKLDGLLDDLSDIEESFSLDLSDDPLLFKIAQWEELGYFVDGLKTSLTDDRKRAEEEAKQFEVDVERMEKIKERYMKMNLTGFDSENNEIRIKLQYPHLSKEVENQLDNIERIMKQAELEIDGMIDGDQPLPEQKEDDVADEEPSQEKEEPEIPPEEEIPDEDDTRPEPAGEEEQTDGEQLPEEESQYAGRSADELIEMAKESYKEGNLEDSLILFKEALKKDPDSSKARFMIRRISSKLS